MFHIIFGLENGNYYLSFFTRGSSVQIWKTKKKFDCSQRPKTSIRFCILSFTAVSYMYFSHIMIHFVFKNGTWRIKPKYHHVTITNNY